MITLSLMQNRKMRRFITAAFFIIVIFVVCMSQSKIVEAADTWLTIEGNFNGVQEDAEVKENVIIQTGIHNNADDDSIRYRTLYYYMTKQDYDIEQLFTAERNINIAKRIVTFRFGDEIDNGSTKTVQYIINRNEFLKQAGELGITGDYLHSYHSATLYMNNIFQIFQRNATLYSPVIGYQEMLNKVTWSDRTKLLLKGYYNYKYVLSDVSFKVKVIAVDKENNVLDDDLLGEEKYAIFSEKTPGYTLTHDTIVKNGITYEYQQYYFYTYKDRSSKDWKKSSNQTGKTANFAAPDAEPGSTLTVKMVFDKVADVNVVVKALDRETKVQIYDGDLYTCTKKPNEEFEQPTNSIHYELSYRGTNYTRTYFYTYEYENTSGVWITKNGRTKDSDAEKSVILTIPNDVEHGSTLTINTLYDPDPPGDIPVTVNAILVDTNGHETTMLQANATVSGDAEFTYNIDASIPSGGKTYFYNGVWKWQFRLNSTSNNIAVRNGSGTVVRFDAPSTDDISGGITVNIYYDEGDPDAGEITLRVIMVTSTGSLISQISTETVTTGQSISKTAPSTKSVNGLVYSYMSKWDYNYFTSSANPSISGTGATASFQIPATTKLGTIVTLRLYYSTSQSVVVPVADAPISLSLDSPTPTGVINGDKYGDPYFNSSKGIPTTESQYVFVKTKDYLLGYTLVNRTGKVTYIVPVTMSYTLKYYTATPVGVNGGPRLITEIVKDTQYIEVEKAYSYWEITNLEYYVTDSAKVYNYSLPDGSVTLTANNSYLNIPSLSTWHGSTLNDHVMAPLQVTEGIEVDCTTIYSSTTSTRPNVEFEDLTAYAYTMTDEAYVRNDSISFNGSTVMSNAFALKIAPDPNVSSFKHCTIVSQDKALFTQNRVIDAKKINGSYSSNGVVTYKLNSASVNASYSSKVFNIAVNDVIIHTPVICDPVISADNDKWVQLLSPLKGAVHVVLDSDTTLNDFTVSISNTLQHSNRLGYLIRDFSRSFIDPINISYIAIKEGIVRNEVKFPFDVYMDVLKDKNPDNDKFIKAGTWIVLGRDLFRFYVPMWVQEGSYTAQFRTVAVNGTDRLNNTETTKNADINNYVATATQSFQVSGRIYGMSLYDVSDYPNWENIFRVEKTMLFKLFEGATDGTTRTAFHKSYSYYYKVGTKDQYGNDTGRISKYTIPMVNNSHPQYKNLGVLKTGYAVRFFLDTTGEMYSSGCQVKIIPTFYYVDADGKNRRRVDLYYNEEIKDKEYRVVKVGNGIDLVNIQTGTTGNIYNRIPEEEIRNTAAVMKTTYKKIYNQSATMYSYSVIRLLKEFRTFIGVDYASFISRWSTYSDVRVATGLTKTDLSKFTQRWYGNYKIPTDVYVVPAGYDVFGYLKNHGIDYLEDFWLKGGYIIVNFNIVTIDKNSKEHLSYINSNNYLHNGNCSMWVTEGAVVSKEDKDGKTFNFKAGDYIIYYTDKSYSDDYRGELY